ncbi:20702_t:CDS:2 [Dentiscutata erythropus]|uniref:20702_t:CDS:1 n=1 Tax=Dentiscutata erythropus TaxID=1348616 RepID=A0A9N9F7T0_9GLOM|nr:20702_t:CDS:2 [Dentiscutata erythropus]
MNNSTKSFNNHYYAISPFKKGMDAEQDLGMHRKNGEEEREVTGSLRHIPLSERSEKENNSKARTTNQIPNNISTDKRIDATMQQLPELSELLEQLKDGPYGYRENSDEELLHPEDKEPFWDGCFDVGFSWHYVQVEWNGTKHEIYGKKPEGRSCEPPLLSREYMCHHREHWRADTRKGS